MINLRVFIGNNKVVKPVDQMIYVDYIKCLGVNNRYASSVPRYIIKNLHSKCKINLPLVFPLTKMHCIYNIPSCIVSLNLNALFTKRNYKWGEPRKSKINASQMRKCERNE